VLQLAELDQQQDEGWGPREDVWSWVAAFFFEADGRATGAAGQSSLALQLNESDEITHHFELVDRLVSKFHPELGFDDPYQLDDIKPIGFEIGEKIGLVTHNFLIHIQMFGDEPA